MYQSYCSAPRGLHGVWRGRFSRSAPPFPGAKVACPHNVLLGPASVVSDAIMHACGFFSEAATRGGVVRRRDDTAYTNSRLVRVRRLSDKVDRARFQATPLQ